MHWQALFSETISHFRSKHLLWALHLNEQPPKLSTEYLEDNVLRKRMMSICSSAKQTQKTKNYCNDLKMSE